MKTIKILFVALLLLAGTTSMAQQLKLAYINSNEIVSLMPEIKTVQEQMQTFEKELNDTYQGMQTELTNKATEYKKNAETWPDAVKAQKEKELNGISENIQTFNAAAEQDMQKKYSELMQPVLTKVQDAINAIGKENSITYILDTKNGTILYIDEASAINAAPLVKAKLGLK